MNIKTLLWEQMGPLAIFSTLSATVFFTPHANSREFANAFGLSYRDVNYSLLYAAFGFLALVAWSFSLSFNYKIRIAFSATLYLAGAILFCISYWLDGSRRIFISGQILIGCNFAIIFVLCVQRGLCL
jgi:hypothetical protein